MTDDFGIAESMNQFFSSVSSYIGKYGQLDYVCDRKLLDIQCSTAEVENHSKVLDIYKSRSPSPDNISPRVLIGINLFLSRFSLMYRGLYRLFTLNK